LNSAKLKTHTAPRNSCKLRSIPNTKVKHSQVDRVETQLDALIDITGTQSHLAKQAWSALVQQNMMLGNLSTAWTELKEGFKRQPIQ
jgi:hypothetical protein